MYSYQFFVFLIYRVAAPDEKQNGKKMGGGKGDEGAAPEMDAAQLARLEKIKERDLKALT